VAVELSADSARALVERILAALASGEAAHGAPASTSMRAKTDGLGAFWLKVGGYWQRSTKS